MAFVLTLTLTPDDPQDLPGIYVIDWDAAVDRIDADNLLKRNEVLAQPAFTKAQGMDGFEFQVNAVRSILKYDERNRRPMNDHTSILIIDGGLVLVGGMRADTDLVVRHK